MHTFAHRPTPTIYVQESIKCCSQMDIALLTIKITMNSQTLKASHFSKLIHHKLSQNCMYWSNLVWSNTNMFEKNVRLSFKKRFLYFWSFCFGVGLWVSVCILVKGLCESEGFSYWREQMKCKNFSFMKTTLGKFSVVIVAKMQFTIK